MCKNICGTFLLLMIPPTAQRNKVLIDPVEVRTPMYQRVYQYLDNLSDKDVLENFRYIGTLKGNDQQCLETIMRCVATYVHFNLHVIDCNILNFK